MQAQRYTDEVQKPGVLPFVGCGCVWLDTLESFTRKGSVSMCKNGQQITYPLF